MDKPFWIIYKNKNKKILKTVSFASTEDRIRYLYSKFHKDDEILEIKEMSEQEIKENIIFV